MYSLSMFIIWTSEITAFGQNVVRSCSLKLWSFWHCVWSGQLCVWSVQWGWTLQWLTVLMLLLKSVLSPSQSHHSMSVSVLCEWYLFTYLLYTELPTLTVFKNSKRSFHTSLFLRDCRPCLWCHTTESCNSPVKKRWICHTGTTWAGQQTDVDRVHRLRFWIKMVYNKRKWNLNFKQKLLGIKVSKQRLEQTWLGRFSALLQLNACLAASRNVQWWKCKWVLQACLEPW